MLLFYFVFLGYPRKVAMQAVQPARQTTPERDLVLLADNRISIRERSFPDLLDMALHVIRAYAVPLAVALAVGVVPAMVLNAWLLAPLARVSPQTGLPTGYIMWMLLLVLWEAPLVTAPVTLYLGQALFTERPQAGRIVRSFFASLPQLIWYQLFVRAFMVVLIPTWLFLFISWAYLNEVILLERNRFWSGRGKCHDHQPPHAGPAQRRRQRPVRPLDHDRGRGRHAAAVAVVFDARC